MSTLAHPDGGAVLPFGMRMEVMMAVKMTPPGSRLSLSDIKSKSRCHQCSECPQRGKAMRPGSRSSASVSGNSTMSTGFFTTPPTLMASGGHQFLTTTVHQSLGEYMCGLSFVFLGTSPERGMALVDTAAQHGLVGQDTLERHDHLLRHQYGLYKFNGPKNKGVWFVEFVGKKNKPRSRTFRSVWKSLFYYQHSFCQT